MLPITTEATPNCFCSAMQTSLECPSHGKLFRSSLHFQHLWRRAERLENYRRIRRHRQIWRAIDKSRKDDEQAGVSEESRFVDLPGVHHDGLSARPEHRPRDSPGLV
jgi:hypothetical protein